MPASALDCLSALRIDYPMMFSIQNTYDDCVRTSHCGVLEFTAEEGFVFLPQWMMDNLKILEGDLVLLKDVSLPKGTYVKLQPHTTDFINISDPKAVLEKALKKFACLTTGDTITISHNQKKFSIDVVETKPNSAISIIDTDCEEDFAAPLDYIEPEKKGSHVANKIGNSKEGKDKQKFVAFSGLARRLDGAVPVGLQTNRAARVELDINRTRVELELRILNSLAREPACELKYIYIYIFYFYLIIKLRILYINFFIFYFYSKIIYIFLIFYYLFRKKYYFIYFFKNKIFIFFIFFRAGST
ncbi:unnamed protein product [Coffea canephora]|uniref:Ubiquitin fusion degradation protein 1 homolog n=1 Tax=Coffea canephora TaxID=49390 RepID=A0A068TU34_COFCA|nr:unnamed protein product [Coffea canephora]